MELILIAAVAANGIIGRDGSLPWHIPEDLAHFKATTMGHPVIMGRVAFEDILDHLGTPLSGRTNIVLSRSNPSLPQGVRVVENLESAVEEAKAHGSDRAFIAGGATVYEAFLDRADRMILSELHEAHEGDVIFPAWEQDVWNETRRTECPGFDIVEYERQ